MRDDREAECTAALRDAGFERDSAMPGMVLDPIRDGSKPVDGIEIRRAESAADLKLFQETALAGFGFPGEIGRLFITEQFQALPGVELFLGLRDGEPVCTSSLVRTADVAGIYWVATLEAERGRGLGEAITWAAVRAGLAVGCRIASLQASEMGRPVYTRMGFTAPIEYVKYERV